MSKILWFGTIEDIKCGIYEEYHDIDRKMKYHAWAQTGDGYPYDIHVPSNVMLLWKMLNSGVYSGIDPQHLCEQLLGPSSTMDFSIE